MTTAAAQREFAVLDQLIVRALATVRLARAACEQHGTQQDLDLRDRAEENLDALLDFRHAATHRPVPAGPRAGDRLTV
jgi:hypothetical protein